MNTPYKIVGHRGWPQRFPENSAVGGLEAFRHGADAVELDVQFSADGESFVVHDESLQRTADANGSVHEHRSAELKKISVHEPRRFGSEHFPCYLSSLRDYCDSLNSSVDSGQLIFIEVKEESIGRVGRQQSLREVLAASSVLGDRRAIISFDYEFIRLAKHSCRLPLGWILEQCNETTLQQAFALGVEMMATDWKKIPPHWNLRSHPWSWFIYDIVDPHRAAYWAERGVDYIETWDLSALYNSRDS